MKLIELLNKRRSYYDINKEIPVGENDLVDFIKNATELVPDAFNMKSSKLLVVTKEKHEELWDNIYNVFEGKVARDKIDSFKKGYGTVLFFYDENVVKELQNQFPAYANNFIDWAIQASGMLQINIWTGLRELGIGASLQHYNPVIDDMIKKEFNIPSSYVLKAQMPFGGIKSEPEVKEKEDIDKRVKFY